MFLLVCLQMSPSPKDTGHVGSWAILFQYECTLTDYTNNDRLANKVTIRSAKD